MTEIVDGTAELVPTEETVSPPAALFHTNDPVEVVERATEVADALKDVIVKRNLFTQVQGKTHVNVEGWQLVGAMLGVTAVCVATEEVDGGYKATVEARTADGRVIGRADALCTKHEKRGPWKSADDYARLSMAQTRATSKALKGPLGFVISLAGYETTPAEEMTFAMEDTAPQAARPAAKAAPAEQTEKLATAKQRGLINHKANEAGLSNADLAGIVSAAGGKPREFKDTEADSWLRKAMDRLPARLVDPILEGIGQHEGEGIEL